MTIRNAEAEEATALVRKRHFYSYHTHLAILIIQLLV